MIVLLPPSEGKARPAEGAPLDLEQLSFPRLNPQRERLLRAVTKLSGKRGLAALGLSASQAGELELNAGLLEAPAAPAADVYTGVLYERLRLPELPNRERVLIASALWGFLQPDDRIPAYRLSMGAKLPRLPGLAAWWKPHLTKAVPDEGLFVDMRSGPYAAAWKPKRGTLLPMRAFTADGKVVSHMAKATRGEIARALLLARQAPETAEDVAEIARGAGFEVRLDRSLDVIVHTPTT
jgi:hypothetical protein